MCKQNKEIVNETTNNTKKRMFTPVTHSIRVLTCPGEFQRRSEDRKKNEMGVEVYSDYF